MSVVGFVDDSTGSCNDFKPSQQLPLEDLFRLMELDAQKWNNLLYCSGGKLELPKCSFHVLHFDFQPDGRPIPTIEQYNGKISIIDQETQASVPITAKRAFEPHKTLGHWKSPYSALKATIQVLQDKADHLALLISMSPITRYGVSLAYNTVYLPTIKYTLLDQAQSKSMNQIIAKCGYNRHKARAVMFAPITYAGGGFVPWAVLQGEGQILHLLKHWRTNSIVSATLRIAVEWVQWQTGHEVSIFEDTTTTFPYLECRWLKSTQAFMATIGATVQFDIDAHSSQEFLVPDVPHQVPVFFSGIGS